MGFVQWSKIPKLYPDSTIVCIASGPSLTREDCAATEGMTVIAVNDVWRFAPHANVLYACDGGWWNHHKGVPDFKGIKVTFSQDAAKRWGLKAVTVKGPGVGMSRDPGFIRSGGNSGFQAVNLAILFGARRVLLLGYDMQATGGRVHFFGDHPRDLRNSPPPTRWAKNFADAVPSLDGIEIINCTRETAITCFPRMSIEDAMVQRAFAT